jgi:hypothetical protein
MEATPEELGPMRSGSDSSGFWLVRPVRAWSWNTYQRWKETYQSRDEQRFSASQKKGKMSLGKWEQKQNCSESFSTKNKLGEEK